MANFFIAKVHWYIIYIRLSHVCSIMTLTSEHLVRFPPFFSLFKLTHFISCLILEILLTKDNCGTQIFVSLVQSWQPCAVEVRKEFCRSYKFLSGSGFICFS